MSIFLEGLVFIEGPPLSLSHRQCIVIDSSTIITSVSVLDRFLCFAPSCLVKYQYLANNYHTSIQHRRRGPSGLVTLTLIAEVQANNRIDLLDRGSATKEIPRTEVQSIQRDVVGSPNCCVAADNRCRRATIMKIVLAFETFVDQVPTGQQRQEQLMFEVAVHCVQRL